MKEAWCVNTRKKFVQDFAPSEKDLLRKLGLKKGEKILVFAGFAGDWARALSKDAKVTYSDISEEIVKQVKKTLGE